MSQPRKIDIDDVNEYHVLVNALEALADTLDEDDEDSTVIAILLAKLGA